MVCVAASDGCTRLLPAGTKQRSATASACGPESRMTASPPSPSGVAIAAMVSSNIEGRLQVEGWRLQVGPPKRLGNAPSNLRPATSDMPATALGVFGVAALQEKAGFL